LPLSGGLWVGGSQAFGAMGNQQGFHGCGRPIPANATLQFELQLLDWEDDPVHLLLNPHTRFTSTRTTDSVELTILYRSG
jgi:hypothetical protein